MDKPGQTGSAPGCRPPARAAAEAPARARHQGAASVGGGRGQPTALASAPRGRASQATAAQAPSQRAGNSTLSCESGGRGVHGGQSVPPAPKLPSAVDAGSRRPGKSVPPNQRRKFVQKEGFSVLKPDKHMHEDLVRRQRLADQARPKPQASDMRFTEVLDPKAAQASGADKAAARERWVAEMQAKADPRQIRRAAQEAEAVRREEERMAARAKREEFEQQWCMREAMRKQALQQRTLEVNAQARQRWSQCALPESQAEHAEPVLPVPEHVDFGSVRRRLAAEQRRSQSTGAVGTRSGKAALAAQAAAARRQQEQQQEQQQQQHTPLQESHHEIIQAQDQEFQLSLLHDEIKDLLGRKGELLASATPRQGELEELQLRKAHAEQRLERYGENPRLISELQDLQNSWCLMQEHQAEANQRLAEVEAELNDRQELLVTLSATA